MEMKWEASKIGTSQEGWWTPDTGEKIHHFYPLASWASGIKNPLALMIFYSPLLVAGLCAIRLNHWLMIFFPSDPSSVGLA